MRNKYRVALTTGLPAASRAQLGEPGCRVAPPLGGHHPKGLKDHEARLVDMGYWPGRAPSWIPRYPGIAPVESLAHLLQASCPGALGPVYTQSLGDP